ncbi:MAG: branched-chain amino acid ABC transporter permease [Chloroflexota bacterium]
MSQLLLQQIFSGLALGMVYGGIALALSVVYEGTGVLNFSQGALAVVSTFIAWQLLAYGLPFWIAFLAAVVLSFFIGVLVERVFIRRVAAAPELSILIVTLALFLGLRSTSGIIWSYLPKDIVSPFGRGVFDVGGATVTAQQVGMTGVIVSVLGLVAVFFRFTDVGLRLRASAQNPASSRLLGISVGRQLMIGWGLAAAVGAVAGIMAAPLIGLSPDSLSSVILLAFASAALGGFRSRLGAVLGGLTIGVLTNLGSAYVPGIGGDLDVAVPFVILLLILLVRPQGVFGRASTVRA